MTQPFFRHKSTWGQPPSAVRPREARLSHEFRQPEKVCRALLDRTAGATVPTWSPTGGPSHLPGRSPLSFRVGYATQLLIGISQEGMGFAGIGLDPGRFF